MSLRHTDQLVVRPHRPGRRQLELLFGLLAVALGFSLGLFLGSRFFDQAVVDNHRMNRELASLREEDKALRQQVTSMEMASDIDKRSLEEVRKFVTSLQLQLAANEEELRLYRNLLQDGGGEIGLQIGELKLKSLSDESGIAYRVIIQQKESKLKSVKINIKVELEGARHGIKEALGLDQLDSQVDKSPMVVKLKYFHIQEGVLILPEGFEPRALKVSVWKANASANPVERRFDWQVDDS
ncbi:DUF6776 family protein [Porticoccus sp.]